MYVCDTTSTDCHCRVDRQSITVATTLLYAGRLIWLFVSIVFRGAGSIHSKTGDARGPDAASRRDSLSGHGSNKCEHLQQRFQVRFA